MKTVLSKKEARKVARGVWAEFMAGPAHAAALERLGVLLQERLSDETRFLATIALPDEPDLLPLLAGTGRPVYAPVTKPGGLMEFRLLYDGGQLLAPIVAGFRDVPGPNHKSPLLDLPLGSSDMAIIPTRAANPLGQRLGRGLGYYDRWRDALGRCARIALLPIELCRLPFIGEDHDLVLSATVTEEGVLEY